MATAKALESLTDPAKFEILAIRVLRKLHPECETLIDVGVNEAGKSVPGPVDAFSLVPGSRPPRYVFAAVTLASRRELPRKWLYDSSAVPRLRQRVDEPGDLIKAGREATRLRIQEPQARFVVYLCTNRLLNTQLMERVYAIAQAQSVELVFLESSRLTEYLDSAAGQQLRAEFLGIRTNRISREHLLALAHVSLSEYQIEGFEEGQFVPTAAWTEVHSALKASASMTVIIGRPGTGKSVIARRLLQDQINSGEMALRIPEYVLEQATSLADAVCLALKRLNPNLGEEVGHEALALATSDHPLLLVLDDANRAHAAGRLLSKILAWGRNLFSQQANREPVFIKLIVPIWESYWNNLRWHDDKPGWLRTPTTGPMLRDEATLCLRNPSSAWDPRLLRTRSRSDCGSTERRSDPSVYFRPPDTPG